MIPLIGILQVAFLITAEPDPIEILLQKEEGKENREEGTIRVLLDKVKKGKILFSTGYINPLQVKGGIYFRFENEGLKLKTFSGKEIYFPEGKKIYTSSFYYRGRKYQGGIFLYPQNEEVLVINVIPIENYIEGVLPTEISPSWPIEALKAQAVAARTYAFLKVLENREKPYHITSSPKHQAYGGTTLVNYKVKKAVEETRGEILTYHGKPAKTFYHSCSGGKTANAYYVWGMKLPYLISVSSPCEGAPYNFWKLKIKGKEVARLVNGGERLKAFRILSRSPSGRAYRVKIITDKGSTTLTGEKLRLLLGPNRLKSTLFKVRFDGENLYFVGKGWGHGVGLCQWGARNLALRGWNYKKILYHYFPGTKISKLNYTVLKKENLKAAMKYHRDEFIYRVR